MPKTVYLPCLDSDELATQRKKALFMERDHAESLGRSAVDISKDGYFLNNKGEKVEIVSLVQSAIRHKTSIPPDLVLPRSNMKY